MPHRTPPASAERWTLVRRARQLITLHGVTGPRRGPALSDLGIISDGALLICNGLVVESGISRRVESLASARKAKEIDASGKIVMPAFVDPDAVLAYPRFASRRLSEQTRETPLRLFSKRRLETSVASAAADHVRHGILTAGAHTGYALDLRDTVKVLRAQHLLQGKPLRIRSILSPRTEGPIPDKWFAAARQKKLASVVDISAALAPADFELTATTAARYNYLIRLRSTDRVPEAVLPTAIAAGPIAVIAPPAYSQPIFTALSDTDGVHVITPNPEAEFVGPVREEIARGVSIALASGYGIESSASFNPQYLLHLATTRLGMTVAQGIAALIWNAAWSLRVAPVTGSLEPGKPADLMVMDVPDYRDLPRRAGHNDVAMVMRQGRTVYVRAGLTLD